LTRDGAVPTDGIAMCTANGRQGMTRALLHQMEPMVGSWLSRHDARAAQRSANGEAEAPDGVLRGA
jgi:hypothetical protein